jgi:pre-mRNA-splicing factor ATP-dependent RNA helicase DHX38/PRP16
MADENVHRLEGSGEVKGGLIIRKKKNEDDFKAPKASLLGLDKLAALKEKERKESEEESSASKRFKSVEKKEDSRRYRGQYEETPTYTGGVHSGALEKRRERDRKERDKGIVVTSKEDRKGRDSSSSSRDRHRFGGRDRDRDVDASAHHISQDRT